MEQLHRKNRTEQKQTAVTNRPRNSACIFVFTALLLIGTPFHADEGTLDPDFDYLPPERTTIFGRFASRIADIFRLPSHAGSYTTAKKRLYKNIGDQETLYCGCTTDLAEREFDESSCGYEPKNDNVRAHRLEAEHILPAFWIANFHDGDSCWVADEDCGSARECCLEKDTRFKRAHNDLVNLIPAIGELNAARSNLIYAIINYEVRDYGDCDFEVDTDFDISEPKENIRGDIARVYFYMRDTYNLIYPDSLSELIKSWDESDPISDAEKDRNENIQSTQGTSNPLLVD